MFTSSVFRLTQRGSGKPVTLPTAPTVPATAAGFAGAGAGGGVGAAAAGGGAGGFARPAAGGGGDGGGGGGGGSGGWARRGWLRACTNGVRRPGALWPSSEGGGGRRGVCSPVCRTGVRGTACGGAGATRRAARSAAVGCCSVVCIGGRRGAGWVLWASAAGAPSAPATIASAASRPPCRVHPILMQSAIAILSAKSLSDFNSTNCPGIESVSC
jgi:hypothetical protein